MARLIVAGSGMVCKGEKGAVVTSHEVWYAPSSLWQNIFIRLHHFELLTAAA
jgi:hypothetical protein